MACETSGLPAQAPCFWCRAVALFTFPFRNRWNHGPWLVKPSRGVMSTEGLSRVMQWRVRMYVWHFCTVLFGSLFCDSDYRSGDGEGLGRGMRMHQESDIRDQVKTNCRCRCFRGPNSCAPSFQDQQWADLGLELASKIMDNYHLPSELMSWGKVFELCCTSIKG